MGKLTAKRIDNIKIAGKYFDGGGLYLQITAKGSKLWRGKYRFEGKEKTASYGAYPATSLKEARDKHAVYRAKLSQGVDPQAEKQRAKAEQITNNKAHFGKLAREWLIHISKTKLWESARHKKVKSQLERHIIPAFGNRDIREIRPKEITAFIQQIDDQGKNRTAHDCLSLIKRIFVYAIQIELMEASPAAHLKDIIPNTPNIPMKHITDPVRIGEILMIFDSVEPKQMATKAFVQLSPMLFTRPTEVRLMRWDEIDGDTWTIPAERMKKRRPLVVPLPHQAIAIIEGMRPFTGNFDHVMTNTSTGKPISDGAPQQLKKRLGLHHEMTWHGWRHTASTLLNERGYNRDHIEAQLAHLDSNSIRGTYNHAQYLDQRRAMLQAWADYLEELKQTAKKGKP